jgi:hypothetical protein
VPIIARLFWYLAVNYIFPDTATVEKEYGSVEATKEASAKLWRL